MKVTVEDFHPVPVDNALNLIVAARYYYYDYETYLCIPVRLFLQRGRYRK